MNAAWHSEHVLGNGATPEQRLAWHEAHQKECACRPVPPRVRAKLAPSMEIDPVFAPIVNEFASDARVTMGGKGFGSSGLKVNGNLFAMISSGGKFVAKLPRERVSELVAAKKGQYFDPGYGRLMKEWVELDGEREIWIDLAKEARKFVGSGGA